MFDAGQVCGDRPELPRALSCHISEPGIDNESAATTIKETKQRPIPAPCPDGLPSVTDMKPFQAWVTCNACSTIPRTAPLLVPASIAQFTSSQMRFDAVDADNVPRSHPASRVVQGTCILLQIQEMAQHGVSDATEPVVPASSCACMRALPAASSVPVPSLTRMSMSQQSVWTAQPLNVRLEPTYRSVAYTSVVTICSNLRKAASSREGCRSPHIRRVQYSPPKVILLVRQNMQ